MAARQFIGTVISTKAAPTVTVAVAMKRRHPLYGKAYTRTKKFLAHDVAERAGTGDSVMISEVRPISKRKHFKVVKIICRAPISHVEPLVPERGTS